MGNSTKEVGDNGSQNPARILVYRLGSGSISDIFN